jgi:hypothetical protein
MEEKGWWLTAARQLRAAAILLRRRQPKQLGIDLLLAEELPVADLTLFCESVRERFTGALKLMLNRRVPVDASVLALRNGK